MKPSRRCYELIKSFEDFRDMAYLCPAGVWTIGYGTTLNVKEGDTCTIEQADEWLKRDVDAFSESLTALLGSGVNQNQFDALVSFVYNVGTGAFSDSTLYRLVRANPNNPAIADEFKRWVYSKGQMLPGLVRRRNTEAELYFNV